ncbi:MAG: glycosyltransferase family 1 protein [Proteobacteria bacterium]|nr:glycosyltransferase family 1 protein [Pseudomonadota bacterium]
MRIVVVAYGTSGDLNPTLEVACALRDAGEDVVFVTAPEYEAKLQRLGLAHRLTPPGRSVDEVAGEHLTADPKFMERGLPSVVKILDAVFIPQIQPMYEAVMAELEAAPTDLVVNHPMVFGSYLASERTGVPFARLDYAPFSLVSATDPGRPGPVVPPAWLLKWIMGGPARWIMNRTIGPRVNKVAAELGLDSRNTRVFDSQDHAVLNPCLWPAWFRGPAADDRDNVVFCGFPDPGAGESGGLAPEIEAFLAAGAPPVVVGLGSMLPPFYPEIYAAIAAGCRALGQRAILVGCPPGAVQEPGDDLLTVGFAPYAELFGRGSVIVHHGGIGSMAEAFGAGRPQVIVAFGTDQFDNGDRAERLGVAVGLTRRGFTAKRFTAALRRCLEDEAVEARAGELQAKLASEEAGPVVAAGAIRAWGAGTAQ